MVKDRDRMSRWVLLLLMVCSTALGFTILASPTAARAKAKGHTYSAEYTGSASWSDVLSGDLLDPAGNRNASETFAWAVKVSAYYASAEAPPRITRSESVSGSTTLTDSDGTFTCALHAAPHPDLGNESLSAQPVPHGKIALSAYLGLPENVPSQVTVSGPSDCGVASVAGEAAEGGLGDVCAGFPASDPQSRQAIAALYFPLQTSSSGVSRRFDVNQSVTVSQPCMGAPGTSETITRKIHAVANLGKPASCAATSANTPSQTRAMHASETAARPMSGVEAHAASEVDLSPAGVPFKWNFDYKPNGDGFLHMQFKVPGKWAAKLKANAAVEFRERRAIGKTDLYYTVKGPSVRCPENIPFFERYAKDWNRWVAYTKNRLDADKGAFDREIRDHAISTKDRLAEQLAKSIKDFWTNKIGLPWNAGPQ